MAAAKTDLPEQLGPSMAMTTGRSTPFRRSAAKFRIDDTAAEDCSRQAGS